MKIGKYHNNFASKVNAIFTIYSKKLDPKKRKTNIKVQKIDESILNIFGIVITDFQV